MGFEIAQVSIPIRDKGFVKFYERLGFKSAAKVSIPIRDKGFVKKNFNQKNHRHFKVSIPIRDKGFVKLNLLFIYNFCTPCFHPY